MAEDLHAHAAVLIDKLDKVPVDAISDDLAALGISGDSLDMLLKTLQAQSLDDLRAVLGDDSAAVAELDGLFKKVGVQTLRPSPNPGPSPNSNPELNPTSYP